MAEPTLRSARFFRTLSVAAVCTAGAWLTAAPAHADPKLGYVSGSDLLCLALNIYHEARNQSLEGQTAVAYVTLNRLKAKSSPTVCDVVFKDGYFSWTKDNQKVNGWPTDKAAWETAQRIARTALADPAADPVKGSTYFHTTAVAPEWAPSKIRVARIGDHIFYRDRSVAAAR